MTLGYLDRLSATRRWEGEEWEEEEMSPSGGSRVESWACEMDNGQEGCLHKLPRAYS